MIGYYILLHVFVNFGNSGMLPAFIAGSAPTLFFLILGLVVSLKK
jgi:lipopolysaccharide export LptBFGC system permease protein LptF